MSKIKVHHRNINFPTCYQAVVELNIDGSDIDSKLTQAWIQTQNIETSWATQSIEIMESVKELAGHIRQRSTSVGDILEDVDTGVFRRIGCIGFSVLTKQEILETSFN